MSPRVSIPDAELPTSDEEYLFASHVWTTFSAFYYRVLEVWKKVDEAHDRISQRSDVQLIYEMIPETTEDDWKWGKFYEKRPPYEDVNLGLLKILPAIMNNIRVHYCNLLFRETIVLYFQVPKKRRNPAGGLMHVPEDMYSKECLSFTNLELVYPILIEEGPTTFELSSLHAYSNWFKLFFPVLNALEIEYRGNEKPKEAPQSLLNDLGAFSERVINPPTGEEKRLLDLWKNRASEPPIDRTTWDPVSQKTLVWILGLNSRAEHQNEDMLNYAKTQGWI